MGYPLNHFLSLSFTPTMLIGLNSDFDMPKGYSVKCNAPPSMFAYPKMEEKEEKKKELVATAVLSTTARAKAREARKEVKKQGSKDIGEGPPLERVHSAISTASSKHRGCQCQANRRKYRGAQEERERAYVVRY